MRRPDVRRRWRDRLPGALLALAINAALLALLVFSLAPHPPPPQDASQPRETVLLLPRLKPPGDPVVIDARPRTAAPEQPVTPPAPPADWSPPLYATPQFDLPHAPPIPGSARALLTAIDRGLRCLPDEKGRVSALCPENSAAPPPHNRDMGPAAPGRNESLFAAEKNCADAPMVLPGGHPFGILVNALTNPSAFAEKRGYCPPPLKPPRVDGVERREQILRQIAQCPPGGITAIERRACRPNAAGVGRD